MLIKPTEVGLFKLISFDVNTASCVVLYWNVSYTDIFQVSDDPLSRYNSPDLQLSDGDLGDDSDKVCIMYVQIPLG